MKAQILLTGVDPTEYLSPQFADLEPLMTEPERAQATVKGWIVKGVEPGGDDVWQFRIAQDAAPKNIVEKVFQPYEVDCRGVTGRGWIRSGQTKGSVDATITFQAVALTPLDMTVILEEQARRQKQAQDERERRTAQREALNALRIQVEARLKAAPVTAASNGASK